MTARRMVATGLMRRAGARGDGGVVGATDDIGLVLGSLTFAEYRASDRNSPASVNPRISVVGGGGVDNWPEEYGRNVALTQLTAETARQPALGATSFNSRPGVTFDGVANYLASPTLSPTIATGARLYWWLSFGWHGTPDALDTALDVVTAGLSTRIAVYTVDGSAYGPSQSLAGTDDDELGAYAMDTGAFHVVQGGVLSTTTNKFARDAVYRNGDGTGVLTAGATTLIYLGGGAAVAPGFRFAPIVVQQLVIAHNVSSITALPTDQQIADVTAILMSRAGL
jgi:hypothetical protein